MGGFMSSGGAGSGSVNIDPRVFSQELPQIGEGYKFQENQYSQLVNQNPLLKLANAGALQFFGGLGQNIAPLQNIYNNYPSIGTAVTQLSNRFGGLPTQLMGMSTALQHRFGDLPSNLLSLTQPLTSAAGYYGGLLSQPGGPGALGTQGERDVSQATREMAAQYGSGRQLGTLGTELLNRQAAQQQRAQFNLGQYGAATGQISNLSQLAQGLGTNLAQTRAGLGSAAQGLGLGLQTGLQALRGTNIAQQMGLASGIQGLQSGGLSQLTGTLGAGVNAFSGLTNPMLSYLSNLFGGNLQARIAQAGINQQGNIANENKNAGLIGGLISSLGSVASGIAMSDERLKTKVKDTGLKDESGIALKTFEFKTKPGVRYLGRMAQDVEKKLPDQVLTDPVSGVKAVVGLPMIEVSRRKGA